MRLLCRLKEPAADSHMGMALTVAAAVLALMLWAILWQASIIDYQRELLRRFIPGGFS